MLGEGFMSNVILRQRIIEISIRKLEIKPHDIQNVK